MEALESMLALKVMQPSLHADGSTNPATPGISFTFGEMGT
jgi:hypothetical protein